MKGIDLTKCNNLRYRAKVDGNNDYGRICVENADTGLAFLRSDLENGYIATWHCDVPGIDGCCGRKVTDFDLVPRDPETYRDWQVGDMIYREDPHACIGMVIFRSGDFVAVELNGSCRCYTCAELFDEGYRLELTDIEKQIIKEREKEEWKPQNGDICYVKARNDWIFIAKDSIYCSNMYVGFCIEENKLYYNNIITNSPRELRPATEEEKKRLFDSMAKDGRRWNAEKKVVEDIPKLYEFRKGEPVLVRSDYAGQWLLAAFVDIAYFQSGEYEVTDRQKTFRSRYCLPYNKRTMHLLGTTADYKEE